MLIYCWDGATGVFTGTSEAHGTSLEPDVPLLPECSTTDVPVIAVGFTVVRRTPDGLIPVLHSAADSWVNVCDYRGVPLYSCADGSAVSIDQPGITPADINATETPRPSDAHVWRDDEWTECAETLAAQLEKTRDVLRQQINAWRDTQEAAVITFEHAGHSWDGGLRVRARLQPTVSAAQTTGLPDDFAWTDADNADVPMTISDLVELDAAHEIALVQQGWKIHARQRAMKSAVEQMTAEQLVAFMPGW